MYEKKNNDMRGDQFIVDKKFCHFKYSTSIP